MLDLLKGVRVVELSTIVLGPMAGQILADFGAEVVKVEAPEGDLARYVDPRADTGESAMFVNCNRNKRSIAIDLKTAEGREVLRRLVARADVFLHNMRLAAIDRLGFGPAEMCALNPRLIYCSAIGFGSRGPYAARPAYDDVIQAASGIAGLPVHIGGEPAYVPGVIADKIAALYAANAIAMALYGRRDSGRGVEIEVPMFEVLSAFVMTEHLAAASFSETAAPGYQRLLNRQRRPFQTADGWLAVLPYTEAHWRRTFAELGQDDVVRQPWFADATDRSRHAAQMYEVLAAAMLTRSTDDWIATFQRLDVPHSRVSSLQDLLTDPHLAAVGFFQPTDPLPARVRSVPQPVTMRGINLAADQAPPELGADTGALMTELGYAAADTRDLAARGIVRLASTIAEI
ncbi:CoA transferase [Tistrella bauzanensis]|jgi:crotonobetainyl-CoA:carnitine CoA-transferase CaiB-like acyl-CoA transferase|uniref:CaiB/BaiF CoA transferase family protein n=1 Tax=Tistrella TaxID=171436 RepID=UPI0031F65753